jgi:hypothetical protein
VTHLSFCLNRHAVAVDGVPLHSSSVRTQHPHVNLMHYFNTFLLPFLEAFCHIIICNEIWVHHFTFDIQGNISGLKTHHIPQAEKFKTLQSVWIVLMCILHFCECLSCCGSCVEKWRDCLRLLFLLDRYVEVINTSVIYSQMLLIEHSLYF